MLTSLFDCFRRVIFIRSIFDLIVLLRTERDRFGDQAKVGNRPNSFGRIPRTRGCQAQG